MKSIVSIHQPLYLPWQPYFGKIICSDKFIFLDDVQYPGGKGYFNRNYIKGSQGAVMLTAPVKGRGNKPLVNEIILDTSQYWQENHWKSIQLNYVKAPFFKMYEDTFSKIYLDKKWHSLSDLCCMIIIEICRLIGAKTEFFWASKINHQQHNGLEHLVDLIKEVNGHIYLTGIGEGSMRYMNVNEYAAQKIDVQWHQYTQHPYFQLWGDFLPNTCILDMLFNCGPECLSLLKAASLATEKWEKPT